MDHPERCHWFYLQRKPALRANKEVLPHFIHPCPGWTDVSLGHCQQHLVVLCAEARRHCQGQLWVDHRTLQVPACDRFAGFLPQDTDARSIWPKNSKLFAGLLREFDPKSDKVKSKDWSSKTKGNRRNVQVECKQETTGRRRRASSVWSVDVLENSLGQERSKTKRTRADKFDRNPESRRKVQPFSERAVHQPGAGKPHEGQPDLLLLGVPAKSLVNLSKRIASAQWEQTAIKTNS